MATPIGSEDADPVAEASSTRRPIHRHSGVRFMLGSVADEVLRAGDLPVLMMHPHPTHA
jgi:nucleotide-binding universal stress UspA family protein